ncbi:hydroxymethylbutenyl pyrophosphate reductase [Brachyspira pilosicoli B2904]|uniref:4-hydroxy-3-methylbut-2-enyl diphosphate reductase n=1 Tax=Brachyspira pilosicoli B2904 TaxID=1133568 RepID=J9UUH1_BRAPL|nr:4-hydroxy-3-methylbut-2-enyl diphosphate reductase [Brachyspira pilosicoli]AFR70914.1 hydroxymethylbutenyl pyrophosphate reductase [Brachyspira pilosicoli B2904]
MKVEIGKFAGFCDGVKYAVEKTFSQASKSNEEIYVDGHLIHNPQTLDMLEKTGVKTYEDTEDDMSVLDDKTVIIRAHGISPERREALSSHAKKIVNLTCKYVAKIQALVKKHSSLGYRVIVIGNPTHPEIIGVCGFAQDVYVVYKDEDIEKLPEDDKKTLIVAQTTLQKETFNKFVSQIQDKYKNSELIIKNTICEATEQRQNEILDIAKRNDVVLVIGGSESSNTRNLYKIASSIKPSFYVEFKEDLEKIDLTPYKNVGIMAGASTPDWLIEDIAQTIKDNYSSSFYRGINKVFDFLNYCYIFFSFGAFLMSYAIYDILNKPFQYRIGVIVALYYLFMSLGNGYSNYTIKISDKRRYLFYQKYKPAFLTIIVVSALIMFYLAYNVDIGILMLTILSTLLGTAYNISFEKNDRFNHSFFFRLFKKLVPFKAIIISIAVTTLLNGSILLLNRNILKENTLSYLFSVSIVFIFMFIRQALIEIKFSQSDKIAGAVTLTTYIDSDKLAIITAIIPIILLIGVIIANIFFSDFNNMKYFIPVLYSSIISFIVMKRRVITSRHLFSILIDSTLYALFLAALI